MLVLEIQTLVLGNSAEYSTYAGVKRNNFSNNFKVTNFFKVEMKSLQFWWSSRNIGRSQCMVVIKFDPDCFKGVFFSS